MFVSDMAPPQAPSAQPAPNVRLIMLGADGQPTGETIIQPMGLEVGRQLGPPWEDDLYLSPQHCRFVPAAGGLQIEDHGSVNGVFYRLTGRVDLRDGDQFRVGQELLRYEDLPEPAQTPDGTERMGSPNPGFWGRLSVLVDPNRPSAAYPIAGESFAIGRDSGDLSFPQDGYVSGRHCRVFGDDQGVYLEDMGSSNGTYVRVRSGGMVPFGSLILVGQKLFQVEAA